MRPSSRTAQRTRRSAAFLSIAGAVLFAAVGSASAAGTWFADAEHFETGSSRGPGPGATTTIAIDVDADGDVDVVATDWFGEGPLVLRNAGDGSFGAPSPIVGASDVGALATGDLDGDGRPDLVGRDGSGVVALLAEGDGTFEADAHVTVSGNAQQSVAVVDTDRDGNLDIVTPERSGVRVLFGRGTGAFDVGPVTALTGLLSDAKSADLDGDGCVDLLVADANPAIPRVVALRGRCDGTFAESGSGTVGYGPEAVMAGDLDGDGLDDAVSVDSFSVFNAPPSFSITVLLSDGTGGFRAPVTYPTGDGPVSGALGDLDGDGALDVAVSAVGSSVVTVYAGDGKGGLTEHGRLPVVRQPQTPVVADLDSDSDADIAVPGVGQLSVLRNTTVATSAPAAAPTSTTVPSAPATSQPPPRARPGSLPATGGRTPLLAAAAALTGGLVLRRWSQRTDDDPQE